MGGSAFQRSQTSWFVGRSLADPSSPQGREQAVARDLGAAAEVREHVGDGPLLGAALGGELVVREPLDDGPEAVVVGTELGNGLVHE